MTERSDGRRRTLLKVLPWAVVGVVMVSLAGVTVVRLFVDAPPDDPDQATSVEDVAELSQEIAETADVDAGIALLCGRPLLLYKMAVSATVDRWETTDADATIEATVSDVADGATGSFVIDLDSGDTLPGADRAYRVFVESRDGRSCITGVGGRDATSPTTLFSRDGYTDVTSPPPAPRS
ncbi:hypothetical protein ABFT23_01185 [Nocardioides sp. C4-1]|uniref:hypothetical protein n=1 Tax=Nocardioides sp. C4-1 TaxID=3151851 RepID=UPI003267826B